MKKLMIVAAAGLALVLAGCANHKPLAPNASNGPMHHHVGGKLGKLGK